MALRAFAVLSSCSTQCGSRGSGAGVAADHRARRTRRIPRGVRGGLVWCGAMPAVLRREAEGHGDLELLQRRHLAVEPVERVGSEAVGPGQAGAQMPHPEPLQPGTASSSRWSSKWNHWQRPIAGAYRRRPRAPASASRPRAAGPCRNAGSRTSPPPPCGGSSPPRRAAGRRGCTSGCAAPGRSAAPRCARRPQACTSSAPKVETPTSVTQIGMSVTARISSSLAGHSSICHRFQSSGKPCTATTSTASSTPRACEVAR